ncbi:MAG: SHOCT domain-containing protein [Solirubrobacteraceae bacterium]
MAVPAFGATEAQQGAQVLASVQAGKANCRSLASGDFDHVGEYVMERMLGSSATHDAMNRQMVATMGSGGETQAHVYMGQRFAGCATGRTPAAFGAMMGMMGAGMMGSTYSGTGSSGMMGSGARGPSGTSGMMGFGYGSPTAGGSRGWSGAGTVMVILMGLLIALAIGALAAWRPWRHQAATTPLETLQTRYARGDIDAQEFDRRREALGGTA